MTVESTLRGYASDVARAFDRAPVECILSVVVAIIMSYGIEDGDVATEVAHTSIAAALIAAVAWGATLAHAMRSISPRTRWIITLTGAAAGTVYLAFTINFDRSSEAWRALLLAIAAVSLVFAVPAFARRGQSTDEANLYMRRINARFFLRTLGIALYGLALFAGLAVALAAVDNLFELNIQGRLYGHVFVWIMIVLVPWVIVGGLDDYVRPVDEESDIARVVRRLATFLVPPLVAIYYLILCAYVIRIAITHELPRNLVSPMVVAAGLLSCIALIVFDPSPDDGIGLRWLRYTPIAFIPLSAVGWWALHARTEEYGWTEFRIVRMLCIVLLLLLAIGAAIFLMRRRRYPLRIIPALIGVVFAIASAGPWGVLSVSRRNQQHRLESALAAANIDPRLEARGDTTTRKIPLKEFKRITGAANYLDTNFGAEAVSAVVPTYAGRARSGAVETVLRIGPDQVDTASTTHTWAALPTNRLIPVPGGGMVHIETNGARNPRATQSSNPVWVSNDSAFVAIGADTTTIPLKPVWGVIQAREGQAEIPAAGAALPAFALRTGSPRGYLTVLTISWEMNNDKRKVQHLAGVLMMPSSLGK